MPSTENSSRISIALRSALCSARQKFTVKICELLTTCIAARVLWKAVRRRASLRSGKVPRTRLVLTAAVAVVAVEHEAAAVVAAAAVAQVTRQAPRARCTILCRAWLTRRKTTCEEATRRLLHPWDHHRPVCTERLCHPSARGSMCSSRRLHSRRACPLLDTASSHTLSRLRRQFLRHRPRVRRRATDMGFLRQTRAHRLVTVVRQPPRRIRV